MHSEQMTQDIERARDLPDPEELLVVQDGTALEIRWPDGMATISAARLRAQARDAVSRRQIIDFGEIRILPGLHITALEQVGAMGVNVHFSDGHARAIYPWPYLRALAGADVN